MKKFLAAAMALVLMLSFTGCGSKQPVYNESGVFIGMRGLYREFPVQSTADFTPKSLLSALSAFTNWNLDLAEDIVIDENKITVSFAETSSIITGLPDQQIEDFKVDSHAQLIRVILDSVRQTLVQGFIDSDIDPDSVEVYFSVNGEDISIPDSEMIVFADIPYNGYPMDE